jgi:hypothetical protein
VVATVTRSSVAPTATRWVGWPHIWTHEEIVAEGQADRNSWWYGLVCWEGRLWLAEIMPGTGFVDALERPMRRVQPFALLRHLFTMRPTYTGEEITRKATAQRAKDRRDRKEMDRRLEIGKSCTHANAEVLGAAWRWCPDCWLVEATA